MKAIGALGAMVALIAAAVGLLVTLGVVRTVPDITDLRVADAVNRLVASGFKIQEMHQASDSVPEERVIRTDPNANTTAWRVPKVTVYVSSGPAHNFNSWRVIASGVAVDFPSGQCLNLDTGQEYCGFDYDIVTPLKNEFISPASGAMMVALGVMDQAEFTALDPNKLSGLKYPATPIHQPLFTPSITVNT